MKYIYMKSSPLILLPSPMCHRAPLVNLFLLLCFSALEYLLVFCGSFNIPIVRFSFTDNTFPLIFENFPLIL